MNEDAGDISGWGLDEIRNDWAYATNHSIDAHASALHAERLATFDRALAAHDEWKSINQEPSDSQVENLAAWMWDNISQTLDQPRPWTCVSPDVQEAHRRKARAALRAAGGAR